LKIGIGSYAYRWAVGYGEFLPSKPLSPFELLEKAAELDAEVVQFCENIRLQKYQERELRRLRRIAEERSIVIEVGVQEVDLSVLERHLKIAALLGSKLLRVALNTPRKHPTIDQSVAIINRLLPFLRIENITLALENHFHLSSKEMVELVEKIDSPLVAICLDTANSVGLLEKPLDTVKCLAPYAVSVHLKDFKIIQSSVGYVITGAPLGQGLLDVEKVVNILEQSGRNPNIILEFWLDKAEKEDAILQVEEEWVRQSFKYIRELYSDLKKRRE